MRVTLTSEGGKLYPFPGLRVDAALSILRNADRYSCVTLEAETIDDAEFLALRFVEGEGC